MAAVVGELDEDGLADDACAYRNFGGTASVSIHRQELPAPLTYCTAKPNSQGCLPLLSFSGAQSAASSGRFQVHATSVIDQKSGILLYAFASASAPIMEGTLCLGGPPRRTPAQFSNGDPPPDAGSGMFAFDRNARIQNGIDPELVPGIEVVCQCWHRDPQVSFASGLSNAALRDRALNAPGRLGIRLEHGYRRCRACKSAATTHARVGLRSRNRALA